MQEKSQLTFEDNPAFRFYQETFSLIKEGKFEEAYKALEKVLENNADVPIIYATMKCLKFWLNRKEELESMEPGTSKAKYLQGEWKAFEDFMSRKSVYAGRALSSIKFAVYSQIIDNYITQLQRIEVSDGELLIKIGESLLAIKDYQRAKETLLYARKFKRKDARISAYLGECYFFLDEKTKALGCYWEAFLINPLAIDLKQLESPIIRELVKKTAENGFVGVEINLWLPVYAEVENSFSVKKELSPKQLGKLQKKIYEYELQYEIGQDRRAEIEPLLINSYICLLDQNKRIHRPEFIQQNRHLLRKLKNLNEGVYLSIRRHYE